MKISSNTHYASRLLLELALHADQSPLSADTLAEQTEIPLENVTLVLAILHEAGFISTDSGSGYQLARQPEDVTLGDVVRLMDGGIRLSHCRSKEKKCALCHQCKTKDVWRGVIEAIEEELDSITLAELMKPPLPQGVAGGMGGAVR